MKKLWLLFFCTAFLYQSGAIGDTYPIVYSQNDPRWRDTPIVSKGETIGQQGCFLAALATIATRGGFHFTPLTLQKEFSTRGEFGYNGGLALNAIELVTPLRVGVHVLTQKENLGRQPHPPLSTEGRKIASTALLRGEHVLARVSYRDSPDYRQHWVILERDVGYDFLIADPVDGERAFLERRYGKRWDPFEKLVYEIISYTKN